MDLSKHDKQKRLNQSGSRNSNNQAIFTDPNGSFGPDRKQLKISFIERDRFETGSYVQDLERTIKINKEVIAELLKGVSVATFETNICQKLNSENAEMHKQIAEIKKSQIETQGKLLISEQIIKEIKLKEYIIS